MAAKFRHLCDQLVLDEQGATLVEYIFLLVFIALACLVGLTFLGNTANNKVNNIGRTMDEAGS